MSIVTRFPPEPSGYLHIGDLKAIFTNFKYAEEDGFTLLRFDDTNPNKSSQKYVDDMIADLKTLQVFDRFKSISYTSDYFDQLLEYATQFIQLGLAYVDFSTPDEITAAKEAEIPTSYRKNDRDTNLIYWGRLIRGEECPIKKTQGVLRLKIDLHHKNKCMRDPIIYRVIADIPHYRTKTVYKAYPVYDFSCPIVDGLEGVTLVLRAPQFKDKDELHSWILSRLKFSIPKIKNYSKMNFSRTILSKRVINRLINKDIVAGPLDPRLDTLRGLLRRGITLEALQKFFSEEISVNARSINLDWHKLYNYNRKELNQKAYPVMAIADKDKYFCQIDFSGKLPHQLQYKWRANDTHIVKIPVNPLQAREAIKEKTVASATGKQGKAFFQLRKKSQPNVDSDVEMRNLTIDKSIYLDSKDVNLFNVGDYVLLINWITIKITEIDPGLKGKKRIKAIPVASINIKDISHKVSWVSSHTGQKIKTYYFDHLIEKDDLTDEESAEIEKYVNPKSVSNLDVWVDDSFSLEKKKYYQLMRMGFFIHDATGFLYYIKDPNNKKQFLLEERVTFLA